VPDIQLYQNDSRWKDEILGFGQTQTIGQFGCLLTALAMVGNHYGGNETPSSFNQKMKQAGGFSGPWIRSAMISAVYPGIRYQKHALCDKQPAPLIEIDAGLAAGSLVVVMVDYSPDPGVQGHWVVLHHKQGDDYLMWDPWKKDDGQNTLAGRFGFAGDPGAIIQEAIWFGQGPLPKLVDEPAADVTGTTPKVDPAAPSEIAGPDLAATQPGDGSEAPLILRPVVDGLTLRKQPWIAADNVIKYLSRSAGLVSMEPVATAKNKIGRQGQWLHVRDIEDDKGYAAAWFVTLAEDPALGVPATEEINEATQPEKLVVLTTSGGLSLRTQPRVAPETLIRLLPFGTELLVIRTANALDKIGVFGQWLQVRTLDGVEGYVAAWYIARK